MKHVTTWQPDTCGCTVEYEWDDEVSQDERLHVPVNGQTCDAHSRLESLEHHYNTVLEENQRKNKAHAKAAELFPHLTRVDDEGNKVLRVGAFKWEFDANRKLLVSAEGLSTEDKHLLNSHTPPSVEVK